MSKQDVNGAIDFIHTHKKVARNDQPMKISDLIKKFPEEKDLEAHSRPYFNHSIEFKNIFTPRGACPNARYSRPEHVLFPIRNDYRLCSIHIFEVTGMPKWWLWMSLKILIVIFQRFKGLHYIRPLNPAQCVL